MEWIALGDLHLRLHHSHGVETPQGNTRYLDTRDRIQSVAKAAVEKKIDFLVLLGDEFDSSSPNVSEELKSNFIKDLIKPMIDAGIPIFAVAGNHNFNLKFTGLDSLAELSDDIHVFYKTTKIVFKGQSLIFIPWGGDIPTMTDSDIIFGHIELKEGKVGIFERKYSEGYSSRKFNKCKAFYLAHFHKHQTFLKGKGMYVGSLIKEDFGEKEDEKGFIISEMDNDNKITNTFYELPDRSLLEWRLYEDFWTPHTSNGVAYRGSDPEYKIPFTKKEFNEAVLKLVFIGTSVWYTGFDQQLIRRVFKEKLKISKLLIDKKFPDELKKVSVEELREHKGNILREAVQVYCKKIQKDDMIPIGLKLLEEAE